MIFKRNAALLDVQFKSFRKVGFASSIILFINIWILSISECNILISWDLIESKPTT